jgi:hypothetical protein
MTGKMVFNDFEGDMYITTDILVLRVNSDRTIQTSYGISGLHILYSMSQLMNLYMFIVIQIFGR